MSRDIRLTAVLVDKVSSGLTKAGQEWKKAIEEPAKALIKQQEAANKKIIDNDDKLSRERIRLQRASIALMEKQASEAASASMRAGENALRASRSQADAALKIQRQAAIAESALVLDKFDRMIAKEKQIHAFRLADLKGNDAAMEAEIRRHNAVVGRISMDRANFPNTPFQKLLGHLGGIGKADDLSGISVALKGAGSELMSMAGPLAAGAVGFYTLTNAIRSSVDIANQMNVITRGLKFAAGGAAAGAEEFHFLEQEANRLGFSLLDSASGFTQLSAAAKGTTLEGKGAKAIFSGISEAAVALGLSSDQTSGALLAIQQMISKKPLESWLILSYSFEMELSSFR